MSDLTCACDACTIQRDVAERWPDSIAASDTANLVYWSTHCARCGGGVKYAGLFHHDICERCEDDL